MNSGATHHMTGNSKLFCNYKLSFECEKISIADGTKVSIAGRGSVILLNKCHAHNVLHILNLFLNLLCVSKIIKELQYTLTFSSERCVLHYLVTERKTAVKASSILLKDFGVSEDSMKDLDIFFLSYLACFLYCLRM